MPQDFPFLFWIWLCEILCVCVYIYILFNLPMWKLLEDELPVIQWRSSLVFLWYRNKWLLQRTAKLVFSPTTTFSSFDAKSSCLSWISVYIDFKKYFDSWNHKSLSTRMWGLIQHGMEHFLFDLCLQASWSPAENLACRYLCSFKGENFWNSFKIRSH